jgi:hypothetical protein
MVLSPLSEPLHVPVTSRIRAQIVRRPWLESLPHVSTKDSLDRSAYFDFYTREFDTALVDEGQRLYARSHEDMLRIAQLLVSEIVKEEIILEMKRRLTKGRSLEADDRMLNGTINLAIRLLAIVNAGPLHNEISPHRSIAWKDNSLIKTVHIHFYNYVDSNDVDVMLRTDFTARNISRDANIRIMWTDNLVDHLRLTENHTKLRIFHHATFLRHMEHIQR